MTTHALAANLVAALLEVEDPKDFLRRASAEQTSYDIFLPPGVQMRIGQSGTVPRRASAAIAAQINALWARRNQAPEDEIDTIDQEIENIARSIPVRMREAEDPKEFFKRHLPAIQRAQGIKRIAAYKLEDIGIEHQQYFDGRSTAHTDWDEVYVGVGDNPAEAIDDALDNAAQDGWLVDVPAKEAETWEEQPSVSNHIWSLAREEAQREVKEEDYETHEEYEEAIDEKTEENLEEGNWELNYYAALYVREPEEGEAALTSVNEAEDPKDFLRRRIKNPPAPGTWPQIPRWNKLLHWHNEQTQWRRAFYTATGSHYKRNPNGSIATEGGFAIPEPYEYQKRLPNTKFYRKVGPAPEHWLDYAGHDIMRWTTNGDAVVTIGIWRNSGAKSRLNQFLPSEWRIAIFHGDWWWYNAQWPENIRNRLISDQMARRKPNFPWWIPFNTEDKVTADGTLVFGDPYHKDGWAKPDGTVKLPTAQHPIPPPRGVLHPRSHRRNPFDPNQMRLNLEGLYMRRLARWKRIMGKHDRMKEVARIQREVEDVDKPDKKKKKKEGHERLR